MLVPRFDPRDPDVRQDPYPTYAMLRAHVPMHRVSSARTWFVADHHRCLRVLTDPRFSAAQGQSLRLRGSPLPATMLSTDPPEHTRLRAAAAPAFSPAAMRSAREWLEPMVAEATATVTATLASGRPVDLASAFAQPLAARLLSRFLGLEDEQVDHLGAWARAVAVNLDPFADLDHDGEATEAMDQMLGHFADLMHRPKGSPDGALAVLAHSYAQGEFSPGEALATAALLVVGGFDPLAALVTNSVPALLSGPAEPCGDALEARTVTNELLRYDAPIQFTARRALTDVELDEVLVPAGDHVVVLLGSANRDPARFLHPERILPGRRSNPHLSFGAGPHACLAAPLVRIFGELVVSAVPTPWPRLAVQEAVRGDGVVPRGYQRLVVERVGRS